MDKNLPSQGEWELGSESHVADTPDIDVSRHRNESLGDELPKHSDDGFSRDFEDNAQVAQDNTAQTQSYNRNSSMSVDEDAQRIHDVILNDISEGRFPGMPAKRSWDKHLDGLRPIAAAVAVQVFDLDGIKNMSSDPEAEVPQNTPGTNEKLTRQDMYDAVRNDSARGDSKHDELKSVMKNSGKAAVFKLVDNALDKSNLPVSSDKLHKALNVAGYTKSGYQSFKDKGAKKYTGDIIKHTAKSTAKEGAKGAALGATIGAIGGAATGAMAGGVGAVPGAIAGAKAGASVGARVGAKKGAGQGTFDSATGNVQPKQPKITQNTQAAGFDRYGFPADRSYESIDDAYNRQLYVNHLDERNQRYTAGAAAANNAVGNAGGSAMAAENATASQSSAVKFAASNKGKIGIVASLTGLLIFSTLVNVQNSVTSSTSASVGGAGYVNKCRPSNADSVSTYQDIANEANESNSTDPINDEDVDTVDQSEKDKALAKLDDKQRKFVEAVLNSSRSQKVKTVTLMLAKVHSDYGKNDADVIGSSTVLNYSEDKQGDAEELMRRITEYLDAGVPGWKDMDAPELAARVYGSTTPSDFDGVAGDINKLFSVTGARQTASPSPSGNTNAAGSYTSQNSLVASGIRDAQIQSVPYRGGGGIQLVVEPAKDMDAALAAIKAEPLTFGLSPNEMGLWGQNNFESRLDVITKVIGAAKANTDNDEDARHLAVMSLMAVLAETGAENINFGDRDSVGIMQQRSWYGSVEERMDVAKVMDAFYHGKPGIANYLFKHDWRGSQGASSMGYTIQQAQKSFDSTGSNYAVKHEYAVNLVNLVFGISTEEGSGYTGTNTDTSVISTTGNTSSDCFSADTVSDGSSGGTGLIGGITTPAEGVFAGQGTAGAFGLRWGGEMHTGMDIGNACGTPIYSVSSGTVLGTGQDLYGGNYVHIKHDNGAESFYHHFENGGVFVKAGDSVTTGQKIGSMGNTGRSFGCHLHFEWRPNGSNGWYDFAASVDPYKAFLDMGIDIGKDTHDKVVGAKDDGSGGSGGVKDDGNKSVGYQNAVAAAKKYIGKYPYSWGGGDTTGPTKGINANGFMDANLVGFDCSGYSQYFMYKATGRDIGTYSGAQEEYFKGTGELLSSKPAPNQLKAGDILFYGVPFQSYHVAIYIGNGKVIESANKQDGIREIDIQWVSGYSVVARPNYDKKS